MSSFALAIRFDGPEDFWVLCVLSIAALGIGAAIFTRVCNNQQIFKFSYDFFVKAGELRIVDSSKTF